MLTPPRFQQADDILRRVLQPVGAGRIGRHRSHAFQIALQVDVRFHRQLEIARQAIVVQSLIRGPLHVGLAAHRVDAAAGDADVAEQQLQDGVGADVLRAVAVLRRAHGVQPGAGAVGSVGRSVEIANAQVVFLRRSGDAAHAVRVVASEVLLQQLKDATGMLERGIAPRLSLRVQRVGPARAVVAALSWDRSRRTDRRRSRSRRRRSRRRWCTRARTPAECGCARWRS